MSQKERQAGTHVGLKPITLILDEPILLHPLGFQPVLGRRHNGVVSHTQAQPIAARVVKPDCLAEDSNGLGQQRPLRGRVDVDACNSLAGGFCS